MVSDVGLDGEGRCGAAQWRESPHCDARPEGVPIGLVVIHGISLPAGDFGAPYIDDLFLGRLDPAAHPDFAAIAGLRVAPHFLIRRNGALIQYVPCALRAWHAGASSWKGRERCNDFSAGIELEGTGDIAYTDPQYEALTALVGALYERYPITDVVAHSDIAPGRKADPGPSFDWKRLRAALHSG